MNQVSHLQSVYLGVWSHVMPHAVTLLWITALLVVGWLVAGALRTIVTQICKKGQLDRTAKELGVTPILAKGDLKSPLSTLLGSLVYWVVIFLAVMTVVGAYGIASPSQLMNQAMSYLRSALGAVVLVGVSIYFAVFARHMVLLVVNNIGLSYAKILARVAQYVVIGLSLLTAVSILGIQTQWFVGPLHVLVVALAIALAIAVGMGGRDLASGFLSRLFKG